MASAGTLSEMGNCGTNVTWSFSEGTLTISKTDAVADIYPMNDYAASDNDSPFKSSEEIISIVIEDGVTSIGAYAFDGCTALESVTIASSVTTIGENAFSGCTSLVTVEFKSAIPVTDNVTFLGEDAVTAVKVPADNYSTYKSSLATYKAKLVPVFATEPTISDITNLTYTSGTAQSLVSGISAPATGLKYVYRDGETGQFVDDIQKTDAGTYTICYKIKDANDDGYEETNVKSFKATIAPATVSSIAISGIDTPSAGTALDTEADDPAESAGYTLSGITWDPEGTEGNAGYNQTYTASVTATIKDNYAFAEEVSATVNGNSDGVTATKNQDGTYTVSYTFAPTGKQTRTISFGTGDKSESKPYSGSNQAISKSATLSAGEGDIRYTYYTGTTFDDEHKTAYNGETASGATELGGAPKNAGTYYVKASVEENGDYAAATSSDYLTYTINAVAPTLSNTVASQNIVKNHESIIEPTFTGVGGAELGGTVTYTYNNGSSLNQTNTTKDQLLRDLATLSANGTLEVTYTFTPTDSTNYSTKSGTITFTMVNIAFTVNEATADSSNAVTIKSEPGPTYGDTWNDIVTIKSDDITVKVGDTAATTKSFKLNKTGTDKPNQGSQSYTVLFSGTINEVQYTDIPVLTGTVNVAKKELTDVTIIIDPDASLTYTGSQLTPAFTVTYDDNGTKTLDSSEYDDSYGTNTTAGTNAGSITVTVKDSSNYTFTDKTENFTIAKAEPDSSLFSYSAPSPIAYDTNTHAQSVSVADGKTVTGYKLMYKLSTEDETALTEDAPVNAGTYDVYAVISNDTNYSDANVKLGTFTITKGTQAQPVAPEVASYDCSSVTLTPVEGCQYSMDNTIWQDSNRFTGLTNGTTYSFYQRKKATENYDASASSSISGYVFNAGAHDYSSDTVKPEALCSSATCTSAAKYYYSCSKCGDVNTSGSTFTSGSVSGHRYINKVSSKALISEATCTSPAKYRKTCSVCSTRSSSSIYFTYGTAKDHSYTAGGICSDCSNLENGKDGFKSVSVTLTDGVIINYFLLLSDTALADKNAYIHFTSAQGVNTKIKLSEGVKDSEGRYKFKLELLPDQMADEITAQVVYSDNTKGNSKAYSVKEYAAAVDNSGSAQAVKDLADAMLNFGAFTQLYTGENTDNLAADVKDYTENAVIGDEYKHKLTSNISDITVKGATLQIGAYTTIRVKYQLAAGAKIEDFTFKCGDTVLTPEKSGDYYYVYLRNIRPQNLDAMYSFTVSDKTGASATLDYSAFSYMKSILDNADKYDKKVVNLINAMYDYNKAAEAISSN